MFAPFDTEKVLDEILRTDPDALADRARDIAARRAALDAEEAELLATVEDLRVGGLDWFRDPGAWLRNTTGIAGHSARTRLTVARGLAVLPTVLEALREARITFDHARLIADQADSPNRDNCSRTSRRSWAGRSPGPRMTSGTPSTAGSGTSTSVARKG